MNSTATDTRELARTRQDVIGVNPSRARARVRALLHHEALTPARLVAPILVQPDARPTTDYAHIPTAVALSRLGEYVRDLRMLGVQACKLFVYVENKTDSAKEALRPSNLMVAAIQTVREAVEDMVISTEVCGCAWTSTGECAILTPDDRADHERTCALMAAMAVLHADAGADIIGPAAMIDGSVTAIRTLLDQNGYLDVGLTPSVIFHSHLFGPYKNAMDTDPGRGDRRGFQIDPEHQGQALHQAARWLAEGADALLVQPALTSVDVLVKLRGRTAVPITAFSVSREQQLFADASDAELCEYVRMLVRAGADLVITYDATRIAAALAGAR